jgi:5-methylcytosine-specific restriction enzyme A
MPSKIPQYKPKGMAKAKQVDRSDDPRQQALNSRYWRKLRLEIIREWVQREGPYCGDCRCALTFDRDMHVDHVIPHSGQDDPLFSDKRNTRVLCRSCHSAKTRRDECNSKVY